MREPYWPGSKTGLCLRCNPIILNMLSPFLYPRKSARQTDPSHLSPTIRVACSSVSWGYYSVSKGLRALVPCRTNIMPRSFGALTSEFFVLIRIVIPVLEGRLSLAMETADSKMHHFLGVGCPDFRADAIILLLDTGRKSSLYSAAPNKQFM